MFAKLARFIIGMTLFFLAVNFLTVFGLMAVIAST